MAEKHKITRKQFKKIVTKLEASLLDPPPPGEEEPPETITDCEALLAFITAAQAIYSRDCPGP